MIAEKDNADQKAVEKRKVARMNPKMVFMAAIYLVVIAVISWGIMFILFAVNINSK